MSLLPDGQQIEAFEALRGHPIIAGSPYIGNRFHIPDVAFLSQLSEEEWNEWFQRTEQSYADSNANYRASIDDPDHFGTFPNVLHGVVAYGEDGTKAKWFDLEDNTYDEQRVRLVSREQLTGYDLAIPTWFSVSNDRLIATQGTQAGFDTTVTKVHKFFERSDDDDEEWVERTRRRVVDVNSQMLAEGVDDSELLELGMTPLGGGSKKQRDFFAQLDTLTGGDGEEGYKLMQQLPIVALSRLVVAEALGTQDFALHLVTNYDGDLEVCPLTEHKTKSREVVDISHLTGDLEYAQEKYKWRLSLVGEGIVSGKPFVLDDPHMTYPVPEGCIVIVDDEFEMSRIQPGLLQDAAAIVTRGYSGERGFRFSGMAYDHFQIIGRAMADERSGSFVYFKVPHMNPDSDEKKTWEELKKSPVVTVASDGTNVKILIGSTPIEYAKT